MITFVGLPPSQTSLGGSPKRNPYQTRGNIMATKNTVRLHRVLAAKPEKVYRAFIEPDSMTKWLPPNGFTAKMHHQEATVGGTYKMSFTNFTTGTRRTSCKCRQPSLPGDAFW